MANCKTLVYRPRQCASSSNKTLVYFITGNPGLIEYYETFLSHLCTLLSSPKNNEIDRDISIVGRSLSGFQTREPPGKLDLSDEPGNPPFGLEAQIERVERGVLLTANDSRVFDVDSLLDCNVEVILIGHSVGTYILLEVIRRLRSRDPQSLGFKVVGGIGLFPTVTHIAKSENGRILSTLCRVPYFPQIVSSIAKTLTFLTPPTFLARLVAFINGFPYEAAIATARFLKSDYGVLQALHMGRDEMLTITSDKWDEEIWGVATPSKFEKPVAKLYFYFGAEDRWVANETRDELMKARGTSKPEEGWKPIMEIDESKTPHSFCIHHSVPMAEKVAKYIKEIL